MKQLFSALILGCGLVAAQANAACDYPVAPGKFPDGTLATKDEMLAAKKSGREVQRRTWTPTSAASSPSSTRKVAGMPNDHARAEGGNGEACRTRSRTRPSKEVTDVTERFNEQLRAWKAKNVPEKKTS